MSFSEVQDKALRAKLSPRHIKTREFNGRTLSYVEGWHSIAEANRIFGYEGWDRETVDLKCVWQQAKGQDSQCSYMARVRVRVRAGDGNVVTREGHGFGRGRGATPGEAHESAAKEAETDAMKRAFATFGNAFGLALYDKEQLGVWGKTSAARAAKAAKANGGSTVWSLVAGDGIVVGRLGDPGAYCAALRLLFEAADSVDALKVLWAKNQLALSTIKQDFPELKDSSGPHQADLLLTLYERRLREFEVSSEAAPTTSDEAPAQRLPSRPPATLPRRLRDKDHLRFVASKPCLICDRKPSHAHHIRHAQPRALARKVSDEWTVPVCFTHHRALHSAGSEKDWWQSQRIEPLEVAQQLWAESRLGADPEPDIGNEGGTARSSGS